MKRCYACERTLELASFSKHQSCADGLSYKCRECRSVEKKAAYKKSSERAKERASAWYAKNKALVAERNKARYMSDPEVRQKRSAYAKSRRKQTSAAAIARRRSRPEAVLNHRIGSRIRRFLRTGKHSVSTTAVIGCALGELKTHLERQFLPGMSWHNMSEWHIDHIVPLASFTITGPDDPELRRAWALSNLRPLWAKENMSKGAKREVLL